MGGNLERSTRAVLTVDGGNVAAMVHRAAGARSGCRRLLGVKLGRSQRCRIWVVLAAATQHSVDHGRRDAEIAGMELSKNRTGRWNQAPRSGQPDDGCGASDDKPQLPGNGPTGTLVSGGWRR